MVITKSDVEKVAQLAKLKFSETEKERFAHQLSDIVGYMEKLNELDTSDVPVTSHVLNITNVMREDKMEPWLSQDEALANAPVKRMGFFSVPKVIAHE
jgi:aspartyl-tRNA(Asn)/glutamyl-tRNA(Gln) amidotransferase subunit C